MLNKKLLESTLILNELFGSKKRKEEKEKQYQEFLAKKKEREPIRREAITKSQQVFKSVLPKYKELAKCLKVNPPDNYFIKGSQDEADIVSGRIENHKNYNKEDSYESSKGIQTELGKLIADMKPKIPKGFTLKQLFDDHFLLGIELHDDIKFNS